MRKIRVLLQKIIILTLVTFLFCGCGNDVNGTTKIDSIDISEDTENVEKEIQQPIEKEIIEEEEGVNNMPEAQIATTVSDINGLSEYMKSLDLALPHIIIYNPVEGYVIDMKDGEAYHLKPEDRIFFKYKDTATNQHILSNIPYKVEETQIAQKGNPIELGLGLEQIPDYSQFETPQLVGLGVGNNVQEASERMITCYLYAPESTIEITKEEQVGAGVAVNTQEKVAEITITVEGITEFAEYMKSIDSQSPHIIIYNDTQGYVVDVNDGEYYYLQSNDRIFLNSSEDMYSISHTIPEKSKELGVLGHECIPDYSQFENPQECIYVIYLKENPETPKYITCYLYPPIQ